VVPEPRLGDGQKIQPWGGDVDTGSVRLKGLVIALFLAGMLALLALAALPASNGNGKSSAAATTTTPPGKMTLCHRTGSGIHRHYVKINVPTSAVWRHVKHGDVVPSKRGACPRGSGAAGSAVKIPTHPAH